MDGPIPSAWLLPQLLLCFIHTLMYSQVYHRLVQSLPQKEEEDPSHNDSSFSARCTKVTQTPAKFVFSIFASDCWNLKTLYFCSQSSNTWSIPHWECYTACCTEFMGMYYIVCQKVQSWCCASQHRPPLALMDFVIPPSEPNHSSASVGSGGLAEVACGLCRPQNGH